ncbi:hypothetical protein BHM03_00046916 [Ensete ventricosum]|nr:hypothetical protein BHM03_00046916 [Ensete ventricosum]
MECTLNLGFVPLDILFCLGTMSSTPKASLVCYKERVPRPTPRGSPVSTEPGNTFPFSEWEWVARPAGEDRAKLAMTIARNRSSKRTKQKVGTRVRWNIISKKEEGDAVMVAVGPGGEGTVVGERYGKDRDCCGLSASRVGPATTGRCLLGPRERLRAYVSPFHWLGPLRRGEPATLKLSAAASAGHPMPLPPTLNARTCAAAVMRARRPVNNTKKGSKKFASSRHTKRRRGGDARHGLNANANLWRRFPARGIILFPPPPPAFEAEEREEVAAMVQLLRRLFLLVPSKPKNRRHRTLGDVEALRLSIHPHT